MKYKVRIFNKEIKVESNELTEIEIENIKAKILSDLEKLKENDIISTLDQLITLSLNYAIEKYIIEKKHKATVSNISQKIDEISEVVKSSLEKDTLF